MLKILTMVIVAFLPIAVNSSEQVQTLIVNCFTDKDGNGDKYKEEQVAQGLVDQEFSSYTCSDINRMVVEETIKLFLNRIFS